MRNKKFLLMTTIVMIVVITVITRKKEEYPLVVINEVCSRNASIVADNFYKAEDYIELYNTSDEAIVLDGWILSDNSYNLDLQGLSGVVILAHGYKLLYADGSGAIEDS